MKPITNFVLAALVASTLIPAAVMAAGPDSKNQGYLVDNNGSAVVTSGFGLCWRDSDWTPARSAEPCDASKMVVAKPIAAVEPAPAPIVLAAAEPTPAPAIAPAPEPAKVMSRKISFSGDALFAFDKSVLKPEGKTMLDGLVQQLEGASYDKIFVTGHTDRFGSNSYNQKLSERRAQTVKSYLVSKNLSAARIDGEGKGEAQPVTKDSDCRGAKSAKVIACLQPDRRVDIELKGAQSVAAVQ